MTLSTTPLPKDVQVTSLEAYDDLQATLQTRERAVLLGLETYHARRGEWPTAYELFQFMQQLHLGGVKDLNSVRPRLTSLKEQGRVLNELEKRRCRVFGKRALVWRLPDGKLF